jgi:hypothetical protein
VISYMLKGADDEAAAVFGLSRREDGGIITGKRCGISQNLGQGARLRLAAPPSHMAMDYEE